MIEADPLLARGNVRARTANEMLRAFAHVRRFGHLVWLPIYAHHGTNDHLASIQVRCRSCGLALRLTRALSLAQVLGSRQWTKSAWSGWHPPARSGHKSPCGGYLQIGTYKDSCTLQCTSLA